VTGRLTAIALAAFACVALPRAAQAQTPLSLADRLCTSAPAMDASGRYPASADLARAAEQVETALAGLRARGDAAGANPAWLDLAATETAQPDPRALARYCAAAGELMRLSAGGSQRQAQTYLLAAYRLAEVTDGPLASLTAYRLALVGASEPAVAGSRGARGATQPIAPEPVIPDGSSCGELAALGIDQLAPRDVSLLALSCAADRALGDGDNRLAALVALKLARIEGEFADTPGQDRATFRAFARERTETAIPNALAMNDATGRDLAFRLAEATLDYADTAPDLAPVLAALDAAREPEAAASAGTLRARLALLNNDAATARSQANAAILAESRRAIPARLPRLYLLLAEADPARRTAHVHAAYTALENLRPLLPRLDPLTEESSFSLYMRAVFTAAADAQLGGENANIQRAQQIVEAFRQAELQSAFGSECIPARASAEVRDLAPGETILYPLLLPDRVELILVSADGHRRLAPNRAVTRADIAVLVEQIALPLGRGSDGEWRAASRRLYDILIAPVADRLGPNAMLAIVPDGPLRALPFAALIAPDGRYLVQQTRLSIIPSLAFSQPAGRAHRGLNVVAASLQREVDLPVGAFSALAGTEAEARIAVASARSGALVPDFTRAQLSAALARPVDVLHLATHAAFNGRSDRAFIVANGEVIRLSELREMIGRSGLRGDAIDLIILSACETAVGDDEASMGLAGAAVQAGASSVIGSLWQVDDAGTAELMRQFYRRYAEGRSRSEALREAQLALLDDGGTNADPRIWAAFALLGAWR